MFWDRAQLVSISRVLETFILSEMLNEKCISPKRSEMSDFGSHFTDWVRNRKTLLVQRQKLHSVPTMSRSGMVAIVFFVYLSGFPKKQNFLKFLKISGNFRDVKNRIVWKHQKLGSSVGVKNHSVDEPNFFLSSREKSHYGGSPSQDARVHGEAYPILPEQVPESDLQ